jgi:hypothetical protein
MSTNTLQNSFLPTQIPGCQLWLDAQDPNATGAIPANGSTVSTWVDKSGNARNATSAGSAVTYSSAGLSFGGSSYYSVPGMAGTIVNTPFVIFVVETFTGSSGFYFADDNLNGGGATNSVLHTGYRSTTDQTFAMYANDLEDTTVSGTGNTRIWALYLPTASNRNTRRNGTVDVTLGNYNRLLAFTAPVIGRRYTALDYYTGTISEIIVYNQDIGLSAIQKVEGYLAWKWGLVANLDATNPYKTINIFQPNFTNQAYTSTILSKSITNRLQNSFLPTQIPGCQLWVDANDIATVFSDTGGTTQINPGGSVARWNDKSGNNNYLQQATAGSRPVYQNTPGGYNAVYFNGAIQLTSINNNSVTGNTARTMFLIQQAASGGARTIVQIGPDNTTSPPNTFGIDNAPAFTNIYFPYTYGIDNTISLTLTTLSEIWAYYDPSVLQIGGNYNFQNAITVSTPSGLGTSATPWYFGTRTDAATPADSYICECIVYNTFLTTNQRYQVEGYLAWKWGLVASLSAGHPYKTTNIFQPNFTNLLYTSLILAKSITNIYTGKYFSPLSITGAQLWLDAADTTTITGTSAAVTAWRDKSGNANNATVTGTITFANNINGLQSMRTSTGYFSGSFATAITTPGLTCFAVATTTLALPNNSGNDQRLVSIGRAGVVDYNDPGTAIVMFNQTGSGINGSIASWRNSISGSLNANAIVQNTPFMSVTQFDSTNSIGYLWFNGSNGTTFSGGMTSANFNSSLYAISRDVGVNVTDYWIGYVGEVIMYNSVLSTSQRQQVEGYLAWKWGLQKNLPSTHPYFLFPPPP